MRPPRSRGIAATALAIGAATLLAGCQNASPQPKADGATSYVAAGFEGVKGKRVAILSFDDSVAYRLPDALALRPTPPAAGETQRAAEQRRLADFRRLGDLLDADARSSSADIRAARSELFHHAFAAALLAHKVEVVERERIARVLGEQRLNGEDDPLLNAERRKEQFGVEMLPCDYVVVGNPIVDAVDYDFSVKPATLPLCVLIAPIVLLANESSELITARERGTLSIANPVWHDVHVRVALGLSVRVIDVKTGEIVWIGNAYGCSDHPSGLTGLLESENGGAAISELAEVSSLANQLVDSIAGSKAR